MSLIAKNLEQVKQRIQLACQRVGRSTNDVTLVAVTKGRPLEELKELYDLGVRDFGESRVQEAELKQEALPKDIRWHLIGSLQSKKANKVVGRYSLIHSVDSLELAKKLDSASEKQGLSTSVLLEVNISKELSKHGFLKEGLESCFSDIFALKALKICGLMTMAPKIVEEQNECAVREVFSGLRKMLVELQKHDQKLESSFKKLSMGMSQDFEIAIEEGATLIRVGSLLFN